MTRLDALDEHMRDDDHAEMSRYVLSTALQTQLSAELDEAINEMQLTAQVCDYISMFSIFQFGFESL